MGVGSHRARVGIVLGGLVLASGLVLFVSVRLDRRVAAEAGLDPRASVHQEDSREECVPPLRYLDHVPLIGFFYSCETQAEQQEDERAGYFDYNFFQNCTSTGSCSLFLNPAPSGYDLEDLESIARTDASLPQEPRGDGCVGFCFNAIVESVDENDPHIAKVSIISETRNQRTPAIVERSRIQGEARVAQRDGLPVRFACFDRRDGKHPPRFESCVQMIAER